MHVRWLGNITKAAQPNKRKLGTMRLTSNERKIVDNFNSAISTTVESFNSSGFATAYTAGSFGAAVNAFDWGEFGYRFSENRLALLQQMADTGAEEARQLGRIVGRYAFDVTDQRATAWAVARSGELVVSVSDEMRQQVRTIITNSFVNQISVDEVGRQIKQSIGLFPRWANAVENSYQRNLTDLIQEGFTPREAQKMARELADQYRNRLLTTRGMNIARTEIMSAANEGRRLAWEQAADEGLVDRATATKEWLAESDACPICDEVAGEVVGMDEEFSNGEEMPPAHPSCRCTAVLIP